MKTLSLLGALFLPGTYLASVFSMTFFNFQNGTSTSLYLHIRIKLTSIIGAEPVVSVQLWIYFAVTIPITLIILGLWTWFDRRREARYAKDDADLEKNIDQMEKNIMHHLRKRTMSKANTWNTISPQPRP